MLVCVLFIVTISRNEVVSAFFSLSSEAGGSWLLDARKAMTSGTAGYFAPGFIKQFRDILMPIFIVALMLMDSNELVKNKHRFIFYSAISVVIVSMLLTGQRSIIVVLFLSLFVAHSFVVKASGEEGKGNFVFIKKMLNPKIIVFLPSTNHIQIVGLNLKKDE